MVFAFKVACRCGCGCCCNSYCAEAAKNAVVIAVLAVVVRFVLKITVVVVELFITTINDVFFLKVPLLLLLYYFNHTQRRSEGTENKCLCWVTNEKHQALKMARVSKLKRADDLIGSL